MSQRQLEVTFFKHNATNEWIGRAGEKNVGNVVT